MTAPECEILTGAEYAADSITVALLQEVEPKRAPQGSNDSERLLFRHLYETLIRVDCEGNVHPLLAESWSRGERGRRWTFVMREGARFWDGTPVSSSDAAASLERASVETKGFTGGIDSTATEGNRALHVYFRQPHRGVPRSLAVPAYAIRKHSPDRDWPVGTGPFQIEPMTKGHVGASRGKITIFPSFGAEGPVIQFVETSTSDTRDLLEGVVDLMITADPAVIDYAEGQPGLEVVALNWDVTYLLLSTSRVQEIRRGGKVGRLPPVFLNRLARDALRVDARGYTPLSWLEYFNTCMELSGTVPGQPPVPMGAYTTSVERLIVYELKDPVARGLAERIVALASTDTSVSPEAAILASAVPGLARDTSRIIAEGLPADKLASSLSGGDDFAYIVSIPQQSVDPCYEAGRLIKRAHWLALEEMDLTEALIPLVDTRRHVIASRDRLSLSVDWNGDILITAYISRER